jgi:hypothetical protein
MKISIVNTERYEENNGVTIVHWQAEKSNDDFTARSYGTKSFTPDPDSDDFTAFEDLTESMVVGWFSDEEVAQIESVLDADLEAQAQPQVISGTPW